MEPYVKVLVSICRYLSISRIKGLYHHMPQYRFVRSSEVTVLLNFKYRLSSTCTCTFSGLIMQMNCRSNNLLSIIEYIWVQEYTCMYFDSPHVGIDMRFRHAITQILELECLDFFREGLTQSWTMIWFQSMESMDRIPHELKCSALFVGDHKCVAA